MNDPTGMPFAFLYDPNDSRKKRTNEIVLASNASTTSANIQLTDDQMKKIGEFAAKATEKKMKVHIDVLSMKLGKVLEALGMGPNDDIRDDDDDDDQALYNYNKLMSSSEHDEPIDAEEEAAIDEAMMEADVNADKGASTAIDESNKEAVVNAKKGAADVTEKTTDTISSIDHDEAVKAVAEAAARAAEEAAAEKARAKKEEAETRAKKKAAVEEQKAKKGAAAAVRTYERHRASIAKKATDKAKVTEEKADAGKEASEKTIEESGAAGTEEESKWGTAVSTALLIPNVGGIGDGEVVESEVEKVQGMNVEA